MADSKPRRFPFGRSERIKHGHEFTRLRESGSRLTTGCLVANWTTLAPGAQSRLGVITSRRIGGAVIRNRARRLMRESFRLNQHLLLKPVDLVLVARQSILGKGLSEVERDFLTTLRKAGLLKGPIGK